MARLEDRLKRLEATFGIKDFLRDEPMAPLPLEEPDPVTAKNLRALERILEGYEGKTDPAAKEEDDAIVKEWLALLGRSDDRAG